MEELQKKILIVEDDTLLLDALTKKFDSERFTVTQAHNGEEGLQKALADHPDIILLDIIMPKMDGIEMMKKVRSDEWGGKVPIILCTNVIPNDFITNAVFATEPSYYLVKSDTQIDDIVAKVNEILKS